MGDTSVCSLVVGTLSRSKDHVNLEKERIGCKSLPNPVLTPPTPALEVPRLLNIPLANNLSLIFVHVYVQALY